MRRGLGEDVFAAAEADLEPERGDGQANAVSGSAAALGGKAMRGNVSDSSRSCRGRSLWLRARP